MSAHVFCISYLYAPVFRISYLSAPYFVYLTLYIFIYYLSELSSFGMLIFGLDLLVVEISARSVKCLTKLVFMNPYRRKSASNIRYIDMNPSFVFN